MAAMARQVLDVLVDHAIRQRHQVGIGDRRKLGREIARLDDEQPHRGRIEPKPGEIRDVVIGPAPRGEHKRDATNPDDRLFSAAEPGSSRNTTSASTSTDGLAGSSEPPTFSETRAPAPAAKQRSTAGGR